MKFKDTYRYKSHVGTVNYDSSENILYGYIEYIDEKIRYEAHTMADLKKSFQDAVNKYVSRETYI